MSVSITLNNVGNLQDTTTAETTINNNYTSIATAFNSALNTSGDTMNGNLNMNSYQIINLPAPATGNSPLRLTDAATLNGGGTFFNIPTGGTTGQVLGKTSNSNFAVGWLTSPSTTNTNSWTAAQTFTNSDILLLGSSTGATTFTSANSSATNYTLTFPAITDTLVTLTATQTLTNKTISGAALSGTFSGTPILSGANFVTLANIAQIPSYCLTGNTTNATANITSFSIGSLTQKTSPTTSDLIVIQDQAASGALKYATLGSVPSSSGVSSFNSNTGAVTSSITVQTFTSSGTYTPTSGMLHCIIECIGGGGGGGGVAASSVAHLAAGGGGSGGYSKAYKTSTQVGASQTVTVGAGGAGGTAGLNAGSTGNATSVGSLCVANGGSGGGPAGPSNVPESGAGASAGTGTVTFPGSAGGPGSYNANAGTLSTYSLCAAGGASAWGGSVNLSSVDGAGTNAAANTGCGGSGAAENQSNANYAGGNGGSGIVVITEFIGL